MPGTEYELKKKSMLKKRKKYILIRKKKEISISQSDPGVASSPLLPTLLPTPRL